MEEELVFPVLLVVGREGGEKSWKRGRHECVRFAEVEVGVGKKIDESLGIFHVDVSWDLTQNLKKEIRVIMQAFYTII